MAKKKRKKQFRSDDKLERELTLFGKLVAKLIYLLKLIKTLFLNLFTKTIPKCLNYIYHVYQFSI